ncbi:MAG TPA: phage terminase large subunit [Candidatus Saccharimonadales bacterium]|nr:phage terminase large subunit [Candidatus Saccharimonadales bacterium]
MTTRVRPPIGQNEFDTSDAQLLEELAQLEARNDFWCFRCYMHPDMKRGWWQKHLAERLQRFYGRMVRGERPKLVATAPPQHGKSDTMKDFLAWVAGKNPDIKEMFASYSDELGVAANTYLQRMMTSPKYGMVFPETTLAPIGRAAFDDLRYKRNTELIEFVAKKGSFRNTTVNGAINGFGLDFGLVDDPIKGRKEAQSKTTRDSTWSWMLDDLFGRFSENAGLVMIVTRWHIDDPVGRWIAKFPDTEVLVYQAIAEPGDWSVTQGYRKVGEALFPEHKSKSFLLERKGALTKASWESLYQQRPIVAGGGILPIEKLRVVPSWSPNDPDIVESVRYWDKAGTISDEASWTAGVLMHKMRSGRFVISHVVHGQWLSLEREQRIKYWAEVDRKMYKNYHIGVEQEPGSGGKESAENTVRMLAGWRVFVDKVTGKKELRAEPFAAQVQGGNVWLVAGGWVTDYLDEAEVWPQGKNDQIDASSGAFNKLIGKTAAINWDWVGEAL